MTQVFTLSPKELTVFRSLSTPIKIQDFLDRMPVNWEKKGETCMSPRRALQERKMHCMEGAMFAASALWFHGEPPLLLDLRAHGDDDHVVALYKRNGYWGAISKTNHATLRFRDPVYKTLRELALSYFHEYFADKNGKKVLREYSAVPFDLRKCGTTWVTAEEDLYEIAYALDDARHVRIVPRKNARLLRMADTMERRAGRLIEWSKKHPRT